MNVFAIRHRSLPRGGVFIALALASVCFLRAAQMETTMSQHRLVAERLRLSRLTSSSPRRIKGSKPEKSWCSSRIKDQNGIRTASIETRNTRLGGHDDGRECGISS